jgi:hypothetical protein
MAKSKYQFYRNGVEKQRNSDITVDLTRADVAKIKGWTIGQKLLALAFMNDCRASFDAFDKVIRESIK